MNNRQQARRPPRAAPAATAPQPCVCRELFSQLQILFGISPEVQTHFNNSRIEFLKGIRAMIDQRIETMSRAGQQGTKISVE